MQPEVFFWIFKELFENKGIIKQLNIPDTLH